MALHFAVQENLLPGDTPTRKWQAAEAFGFDGIELRGTSAGDIKDRLPELRAARKAGAVFSSQTAYSMTIAGIVWGMLLLNETLSMVAWLAVATIILGLYLVEPNLDDPEISLNLKKHKAVGQRSGPM